MLKGETIYLRMLEPEDWELTYKWHNDTEIQRLTCGPIRIVSKEIEKAWVNSKATNNRNDLYLAICLNSDDSMIGYISIGEIDHFNQSCSWSGVVIGNKQYRDGFVFAECATLLLHYVFTQMNIYRLTGKCLIEHVFSNAMSYALCFQKEGVARHSIYKNGKFNDVYLYALLRNEYLQNKEQGYYDMNTVIANIAVYIRKIKRGESI